MTCSFLSLVCFMLPSRHRDKLLRLFISGFMLPLDESRQLVYNELNRPNPNGAAIMKGALPLLIVAMLTAPQAGCSDPEVAPAKPRMEWV